MEIRSFKILNFLKTERHFISITIEPKNIFKMERLQVFNCTPHIENDKNTPTFLHCLPKTQQLYIC